MGMGTHLLVNMYGCPKELLERSEVVLGLLNKIVEKAGLHKIGESEYQFEPHGATAVVLLEESHISIHTWPEQDGAAAVDIFTCAGPEKNEAAYQVMKKIFKPKKIEKKKVER